MMKAVWFTKVDRKLTLQDIPIPEVEDNKVMVKVLASGICGTDVHIIDGHLDDVVEDITQMGHEVYGEITNVGANVQDPEHELSIGKKVIAQPIGQCDRCKQCLIGNYNHCRTCLTDHLGYIKNGGWAHYIQLEPKRLVPYPEEASLINLTPSLAVLAEPLSCILAGLHRVGYIPSGSKILVLGAGIIGLLTTLTLYFRGNKDIKISEVSKMRLKKIRDLQLSGVEGFLPNDLLTDEYKNKFNLIIDCSGSAKAVENCFYNAAVRCKILLLGISSKECFFDVSPFDLMSKELDIFGSFANHYTLQEACALIVDMVKSNILTPEIIGIKDYPLEEYSAALEDSCNRMVIKSVIRPNY